MCSSDLASFDELLSGLGTKTTFDRLYKAQVMSMKYTSVLPEISSDLKKINKLLLGMISDSEESNGILDAVLDTLGLGDMFGKRKVRPGARARLRRIKALKAARLAAKSSAAGAAATAAAFSPKIENKPASKSPTKVPFEKASKKIPDLIKKYVSKIAWKIIPGVGVGLGLLDAGSRILSGDYQGAIIDAAGAAAGAAAIITSPSVAGAAALTSAQVSAYAVNTARDIYKEAYGVYPSEDEDDADGTVVEKFGRIYDGFIEAMKEDNKNKPSPYDVPEEYDSITGEPVRQSQTEDYSNQASGQIRRTNLFPNPRISTSPIPERTPSSTPVDVFRGQSATNTPEDETAARAKLFRGQNAIPLPPEEDEEGRKAALMGTSNLPPIPAVNGTNSKIADKISSLSTDVNDARISEARAPIVASIPTKSTMYTPPSEEIDLTKLPIASVYNEDFMNDFFGSRQQSFATG